MWPKPQSVKRSWIWRTTWAFTVAGAQAYKRDVPGAEVHILEAGHFALDEKAGEVIALTDDFLTRQTKK